MKKKLRAVEKMFIKTEIPMNLAIKKIAKIQEAIIIFFVFIDHASGKCQKYSF